MIDINLTKEQNQVITYRGNNLLVSAGAGAGKTSVLVKRIIKRIIEEQLDIDKLLILTFTNAAATEMKERIFKAILEKLETEPSKHLEKQLLLLGSANISTIHSFCLTLVRKHFNLLGLEPNFSIVDDSQIIKNEVLEDLFEDLSDNKDFQELLECYSDTKTDLRLKRYILEVYEFVQSCEEPMRWLISSVVTYKKSYEDTEYFKVIEKQKQIHKTEAQGYIKQAIALLMENINCESALKYISLLNDDLNSIMCGEWSFGRFPSATKKDSPFLNREEAKALRDKAKELQKKINDLDVSDEDAILQFDMLYKSLRKLIRVVYKFDRRYKKYKKRKNVVDFGDLEHFAMKLLLKKRKPSEIALKLREQYHEIMVDEYQDSNYIQESIIKSISSGNNVFMVGDVKQSIYRFRMAEPSLFLNKYNTYLAHDEEIKTEESQLPVAGSKILLNKNFRSRKNIINFVNLIFSGIMTKEKGGLDYKEKEQIEFAASYFDEKDDEPVDVILINTNSEIKDEIDENEITNKQVEVRAVLEKVKELSKVYKYKDIVILMQSIKDYAPLFYEEFSLAGIPLYADVNEYFSTIEVSIFVCLLKVIDNPYQDIPLASVLRSPIVDMNEIDLLEVKLLKEDNDFFFDNLLESKNPKAVAFLNNLKRWRIEINHMKFEDFIWYLYEETDFYAYAGAMENGKQRQANLRALFDRAGEFNTLMDFLTYIDKLENNTQDKDVKSAKIIGENDNVVRLMTIHTSKGLEFSAVIVAGCGKKIDFRASSVAMHQDLGLAYDIVEPELRIKYPSISKKAINIIKAKENEEEKIRILYVALTRAKEKLVICGLADKINPDKPHKFLDFIVPIASGNQAVKINIENLVKNDFFYKQEERGNKKDFELEPPSENAEKIYEKLEYKYEYEELFNIPVKLSVTELKKRFRESSDNILLDGEQRESDMNFNKKLKTEFLKPKFSSEKKELSIEKGVLTHFFLQHMNFKIPSVKENLSLMLKRNLILKEQVKILDLDKIDSFLNSDLGNRIKNATNIFREYPFIIEVDICDIYDNIDKQKYKEEKTIVQGVIDCFFEENSEFVLIDYKTDKFSDYDSLEYKIQLRTYKQALEKTFNKKVKESYICFLETNTSMRLS